jgi:hypothetical protein
MIRAAVTVRACKPKVRTGFSDLPDGNGGNVYHRLGAGSARAASLPGSWAKYHFCKRGIGSIAEYELGLHLSVI